MACTAVMYIYIIVAKVIDLLCNTVNYYRYKINILDKTRL